MKVNDCEMKKIAVLTVSFCARLTNVLFARRVLTACYTWTKILLERRPPPQTFRDE